MGSLKSSAQYWGFRKSLFGKTELLHGGGCIQLPPLWLPLGHFCLCSCFSLDICKIKDISGLKRFCVSQCRADYREINYYKQKVSTVETDTKTSPKLPRELFAQIKSNLLCQAFMLQMVFESSSSQPSVVGRGGLLNLKHLAGQEHFPSSCVSKVEVEGSQGTKPRAAPGRG